MRRSLFAIILILAALLSASTALAAPYAGVTLSTDGKSADFGSTRINDFVRFEAFLAANPDLEQVNLYETRLSLKKAEALMSAHPQIHFGLTFGFIHGNLATNQEAYSTWNHLSDPKYPSSKFEPLRYCHSLKALDLGHNKIESLSFLEGAEDLRILILAVNEISDLNVLSRFQKLEYLELFNNKIMDLKPLKDLPYLTHLNLCHNPFTDISPLLQMKQLKRLWISDNFLSKDQVKQLESALPDCKIRYAWGDCTGQGWRGEGEYYKTLVRIFKSGVYEPFSDSPQALKALPAPQTP